MVRLSPTQQDALCVALLAAACMALWIPSLGVVSLNPDESQYQATATYLLATETSAFLPHGAPGIFGLFKLMSWAFGPYPIFEMRVLLQLLAFSIAFLLFRWVRAETNRWCGLLSGLAFLHYSMRFEGLVVNREWFVSIATMLGLALFGHAERSTGRARPWLLGGAGFVCGTVLWFKLQAAFIVFIVPLLLLLEALQSRSARKLLRTLPYFAAGGIGSGLAYLLPFALQGTLSQFLELVFSDISIYVGANAGAVQELSGGAAALYRDEFFFERPYRALLLIAYAMPVAYLVAWARRAAGRAGDVEAWLLRPRVALFSIYLVLAMACVQMGGRFFAHYFLLMLPAVAALVGIGAYFFAALARRSAFWRSAAGLLAILLVVDLVMTLRGAAVWAGKLRWPQGWWVLAVSAAALLIVIYWLRRPLQRAGIAITALLVLQVAGLIAAEQYAPAPQSMEHSPYKFVELTRYFKQHANAGDKLFVWGWSPEIYSLTRLEAASHITFCQYVANDLEGVANRPVLNEQWAALLMQELFASRPRFIVDASARSWYETEADIYDLAHFPNFALHALLRERYRRTTRVDGCDVWERI